MPPVNTTIVSPAAIRNCSEAWRMTLLKLPQVRNCGLSSASTTTIMVMASTRDRTTYRLWSRRRTMVAGGA